MVVVASGEDSSRREFIAGAAALSALLLVGCGDDDGPATAAPPRTRTVTDALGPTVVPGAPSRVIADSVSTYAQLMSLGITPIAAALPTGISPDYIGRGADRIPNVVADDGWTIGMERALRLKPDLIVAVGADYNRENCERYRKAIATFCFDERTTTGADRDIKDTLSGIAAALGRERQAAAALAAYDRRVAGLRRRVQAAGLGDLLVGNIRFDATGWVGIRVTHPGNAVLEALGLGQPDWPEPDDDGYVVLSRERLDLLDEADVLLVNTDDDVDVDKLAILRSPLWRSLEVVRRGRARFVSAWNGGDLPQLHRILDDIEREVIAPHAA
jgi:iron complex transport system substrate-binding protein